MKNKPDRSKAFRSFLLLFTLTIGVIVAAVFFSMTVPFRHNEQLLAEVAKSRNEKVFAESFADLMDETMRKLDSVNLPEVRTQLKEGQIQNNIREMQEMLNNAEGIHGKAVYDKIITLISDLSGSKREVREARVNQSNQEQLIRSNEALNQKLERLTQQYELCRLTSIQK